MSGSSDRQQALLEGARDVGALGVEAGVVDGRRTAPAELLRELHVLLVEAPPRLAAHERQRAERAAARGHRNDDHGAHPELAQDPVVLLVLGALAQELVRDLGVELRLAGPDHLVDAGRRIRVRRIALAHVEGPLAHLGVHVRQCLSVDPSAVGHKLHGDPVGHLGHREICHLHEQLVGIERGGEHLGAAGQEALGHLAALVRADVLDHVDRHGHLAVRVADRRGLDGRPVLLAGCPHTEAHDRLGRVLARERAAAGQRLEGEGSGVLVEDVVAVHDRGGGCVRAAPRSTRSRAS